MNRGTILVIMWVAITSFFGVSTPLLFAGQTGASMESADGSIFVIVDEDPTSPYSVPEVYQFSVSSLEIPVNAFYIVLNYDTSNMSCGNPSPNETDFPLLLETLTNNEHGEIIMALAQPGYGFTSTTTLGSVTCTKTVEKTSENKIVVNPLSKAYAADGFGTEVTVRTR